jgi:hypothetical protein
MLIHADLHPQNLVWDSQERLTGLLDFDDCCSGTEGLEYLALARGTCFSGARLSLSRLQLIIGNWTKEPKSCHVAPRLLPDYLFYVCLYFFVAVNRDRGQHLQAFRSTDLFRAAAVEQHREEIERIAIEEGFGGTR